MRRERVLLAALVLCLAHVLADVALCGAAAAQDGPIYWAEPRRQMDGGYRWAVSTADGVTGLTGYFRRGGARAYRTMGQFIKEGDLWTAPLAEEEYTVRGLEFYITSLGLPDSFGSEESPIRYRTRATVEAPAATPFGHRMICAPMLVEEGGDALALLRPYLGEPGRTSWMMWGWDPAEASYTEVNQAEPSAFENGRGYWIAQAGAEVWSLTGTANFPDLDNGGFFECELLPGWNMVGNPVGFGLSKQGFRIRDGAETLPYTQAVAGNLVDQEIWTYDGAAYSSATTILASWSAFWVHNRSGRTLTLLLPGSEPASGVAQTPLGKGPLCQRVALSVRSGGETAEAVMAVSACASVGLDPLDAFVPPAPPERKLRVACERMTSAFSSQAQLYRDVVCADHEAAEWTLVVRSPQVSELAWDIDQALLDRGSLTLAQALGDPDSEPALDMTRIRSLLLPPGEHRFLVTSGERSNQDVPPSQAGAFWCRVRPNPVFRVAILRFGTAEESEIRIAIVDVAGRQIWSESFDSVRPGEHWIQWEARDRLGRGLPAGQYYLIGIARTSLGQVRMAGRHFILLP